MMSRGSRTRTTIAAIVVLGLATAGMGFADRWGDDFAATVPPARADRAPELKASVTDFGAKCDGVTDDTDAFQRALDLGVRVGIPAATCMVRTGIRITRDGTRLVGEGSRSVVKLIPGHYGAIFSVPHACVTIGGCEPDPKVVVRDVQIGWFMIDGQRIGHPSDDQRRLVWAIFASAAEQLDVAWMHLKGISGDAVSVAIGSRVNVGITVRNSRITTAGRNGIHFGSVRGGRIVRNLIEDTPDQGYEGAGAGNGIDVETEGNVPIVEDFVIEENVIRKGPHATAGFGIQISQSFGPVRRGLVRRNAVENHQAGFLLGAVEGVDIEDNLVTSDARVNRATGGAFVYLAPASFTSGVVNFRRNTAWLVPYQPFADNAFWVSGGGKVTVTENKVYGPSQVFRLANTPTQVTSRNNEYSASQFVTVSDPATQRVLSEGDVAVTLPPTAPTPPFWTDDWVPAAT